MNAAFQIPATSPALVDLARQLIADGNVVLARLIRVLIEIEDRDVHQEDDEAMSMHEFCVVHLGMTKGSAYRRINAANMARRFPRLLPLIEAGQVSLSALVVLRDDLTEENFDQLIAETSGMSRREVEDHLRFKKGTTRPPPPGTVRKLPTLDTRTTISAVVGGPDPIEELRVAIKGVVDEQTGEMFDWICRNILQPKPLYAVDNGLRHSIRTTYFVMRKQRAGARKKDIDAKVKATKTKTETETETAAEPAEPAEPANEPPPKLAKTSGRPSLAVLRALYERDGEQCTHVSKSGRRCTKRDRLEPDHIISRALGGDDSLPNLRLRCRAHNQLEAEKTFGKEHIKKCIEARRRASAARKAKAGK